MNIIEHELGLTTLISNIYHTYDYDYDSETSTHRPVPVTASISCPLVSQCSTLLALQLRSSSIEYVVDSTFMPTLLSGRPMLGYTTAFAAMRGGG